MTILKVFCGECGSAYGSKVWHSTDKYCRIVWLGLCDRITLKEKGKAAVRFRSGVEIEVEY